jgi:hypothetical protein
MPNSLTFDDWTEQLQQDFQVSGAGSLTLRLLEVKPFTHSSDLSRKAYSLLFCGPVQPALPQRMYWLVHSQLGEVAIFLVPIGPYKAGSEQGMGYEAIFN